MTAAHLLRALLASRGMLVATRCALENQIRGLLKTFGLVLGKAGRGRFEIRLRELLAAEPRLGRLVTPLLEVRRWSSRSRPMTDVWLRSPAATPWSVGS